MRGLLVLTIFSMLLPVAYLDAKCCKTCRPSKKACGHYCIAKDQECKKTKGCACNSKKRSTKRVKSGNKLKPGWKDNLTN